MIHENSLFGQYQAGLIEVSELASSIFLSAGFALVICVIALPLGILLLTRRHLRTGASTLLASLWFVIGTFWGCIINPDIENSSGIGVVLIFLSYFILLYLVYRIIYSRSRFYVRWIVLYIIGIIMMFATLIACEFGFFSALSTMRGGFMFFTGLMILLPLLPESSGGGGDSFRDLYLDMVGDEY